jgi:hypothetical protein
MIIKIKRILKNIDSKSKKYNYIIYLILEYESI